MKLEDEISRIDNLIALGDGMVATGPIERSLIADLEVQFGVTLPVDYVGFLLQRGGLYPNVSLALRSGTRLKRIPDFQFFGAGGEPSILFDLASGHQRVGDRCLDGLDEDGAVIEPGWGPMLVPFAGCPPSRWFCFDFYFDAENPPVVEMLSEGVWSRSDAFDGISYVADSFVEFLMLLRAAPEDGEVEQRHEPFESDRKSEWERRLRSWLGID